MSDLLTFLEIEPFSEKFTLSSPKTGEYVVLLNRSQA